MKKVLVTVLGVSALILATNMAVAGQPDVVTPDVKSVGNGAGIYVGGNVGAGGMDTSDQDTTGLTQNHFVWDFDAGYQFNQYIAAELGYIRLPSFSMNNTTAKINSDAWYLAAKGIYPFNDQFDVFAKAGAALRSVWLSESTSGATIDSGQNVVSPLFAVGVEYNFTQNISANVQATTLINNSDLFPTVYMGTVGLAYKFNM